MTLKRRTSLALSIVFLLFLLMRFDPVTRAFSATLVNLTNQVTGILPVANGGTGKATLTAHGVVVGEGTSAVVGVGPGTSGYPLLAQGASADPSFQQPRGNTQVVQLADSTTNPTTKDFAIFDANGNIKDGGAALTTLGDIVTYGTGLARLGVGGDGQLLTARSTATNGIDWEDPTSPGGPSDITHTSGIFSPVDPPTSGWSWVNQGTATITTNGSALSLHIPDNAALNWRFRERTISPSTYTIIAHMRVVGWAANSQAAGIYLYDSVSGKLTGAEYLIQAPGSGNYPSQTIRVERMNSVTSDNGTQATLGTFGFAPPIISFKIVEDGTHRTWYVSRDCGLQWYQLFQEATGSFITPNEAGFGGISVTNTSTLYLDNDLLSWTGI